MLLSHVKHFHPPPTDDADPALFPEVVGVHLGDAVTPENVDVLSECVDCSVGLKKADGFDQLLCTCMSILVLT